MATKEAPREVFAVGCAQLGAAFAGEGFVYRTSHPKMVRKLGDFTEEVLLRTSARNEAGDLTQLWVDVTLSSIRMAAWRKKHPAPVTPNWVGGTALGSLLPPTTDWNLSPRSQRRRTLKDAEHAIRTAGLPYLALLRDSAALERELLARDLPGMSPDALIDPLVCFGGVEAGARYAVAVVTRHPDMAARVLAGVKHVRRTGKLPREADGYFDTFAERLVQLKVPFP
jgi:hypothetical protein